MKLSLSFCQQEVLLKLLDRNERAADSSRIVSLIVSEERFPDYFDEEHPSKIHTWEEDISSLQALGWIGIDRGRGAQSHRIVRLKLERPRTNEIEIALKRMSAQCYFDERRTIFEHALGELLPDDEIHLRWKEWLQREIGEISIKRIPSSSKREEQLQEEKTLLRAISKLLSLRIQEKKGYFIYKTWRRFAIEVTGFSKGLESIQNKLLFTLGKLLVTDDMEIEMDRANLLSHFGIQTKAEVILGHGDCIIRSADGVLLTNTSTWQPFFCVPSLMALSARWDLSKVRRIFTIENEDTFHEWCRKRPLEPNTLVLYLAGFPSHSKLKLLRELGSQREIQFLHWGDLDCGGIEILLFLERALNRAVIPVAMDVNTYSRYLENAQPLSEAEISRLRRLRHKVEPNHVLHSLIESMLIHQLKVEQEAIEVVPDYPVIV